MGRDATQREFPPRLDRAGASVRVKRHLVAARCRSDSPLETPPSGLSETEYSMATSLPATVQPAIWQTAHKLIRRLVGGGKTGGRPPDQAAATSRSAYGGRSFSSARRSARLTW
jgi:hypothetical protein